MPNTLILNVDGNPISIIPLSVIKWQDAVKLYIQDKVVILETYDKIIHSQYTAIPLPSVIMTKKFYKGKYTPKFTKLNIYYRDNFTCQYCAKQHKIPELTLDHVIPKSKKGGKSFENIVTSCKLCNQRKADKNIIKPIRKPMVPTYYELSNNRKKHKLIIPDMKWQNYLNWDEDKIFIGKPKEKFEIILGSENQNE